MKLSKVPFSQFDPVNPAVLEQSHVPAGRVQVPLFWQSVSALQALFGAGGAVDKM